MEELDLEGQVVKFVIGSALAILVTAMLIFMPIYLYS